jgi:hypothetical protein
MAPERSKFLLAAAAYTLVICEGCGLDTVVNLAAQQQREEQWGAQPPAAEHLGDARGGAPTPLHEGGQTAEECMASQAEWQCEQQFGTSAVARVNGERTAARLNAEKEAKAEAENQASADAGQMICVLDGTPGPGPAGCHMEPKAQFEAEQAANQAAVDKFANEGHNAQIAQSALLCAARAAEKDTRAQIREEKSNPSGVVNLNYLHEYGRRAKYDEALAQYFAKMLRSWGNKPLSCSNKQVACLQAGIQIGDRSHDDDAQSTECDYGADMLGDLVQGWLSSAPQFAPW